MGNPAFADLPELVLGPLAGRSEAEWYVAPAGKWNAAQIVEHLALGLEWSGKGFEERRARDPMTRRPRTLLQRLSNVLVMGLGVHPPGRKAPQASVPAAYVPRASADAHFREGVARFFAYLSQPGVQAAWHQNTGYLPVTRAAFELTRAQGFYERNPGSAISFEEITLHPPTENSKGIRLGSFVLIRGAIEDELEQAFAGRKSAQAALDAAVERGNKILRQFERASPDR